VTPGITRSVISVSTPPLLDQPPEVTVANVIPFTIDLTAHETTRLAAVLDALGPHWNPTEIYLGEAQAHQMLYAHLDADQQTTYDLLLAAGELPNTPEVKT
jgi:hypothetical protein